MITTQILVPISLNEHFAVMSSLLVRSLDRHAQFPGDWRVLFTVSGDPQLSLDSPLFAWAREYPVDFRFLAGELWERYRYDGTGLQGFLYEHSADVLIFMDADTIVTRPIGSVVERAASSNAVHAWPAWYPPPVDLADVFREAGVNLRDCGLTYSGYGMDFISPRSSPPYFNFGFVVIPRSLVARMRKTFPLDLEFVFARFPNSFASQVALALNIVRNGYEFVALDERYNHGNADTSRPKFHDAESLARHAKSVEAMKEPCVLHYCVPTEHFQKARDMASWNAVRAFCARPGLGDGHRLLQATLRGLMDDKPQSEPAASRA